MVSVENTRFKPKIFLHPGGSIKLGRLEGDLVFVDDDGNPISVLSVYHVTVRVTVDGELAIAPPVRTVKKEGRDDQFYTHWKLDSDSYNQVIGQVAVIPGVKRAFVQALAAKAVLTAERKKTAEKAKKAAA